MDKIIKNIDRVPIVLLRKTIDDIKKQKKVSTKEKIVILKIEREIERRHRESFESSGFWGEIEFDWGLPIKK